ncbi:sulfatase-like hydrolase/transferase [Halorubrum miltondacostae]|uniref:Sulfatase-like hydrolase/transferase n=1 Tax=Halorubrum miltondacostae TaxID=3076378 RepID=A0ABD5M5Y1_9EURY
MDIEIENIILYIDDAVRYDYSVDRLSKIGQTYKSIAASLHTSPSFASILTGQHVPNHGLTAFNYRTEGDLFSIFDISGYNTAISSKVALNDNIAKLFPGTARSELSDMSPPFVWVERGPGGHAPYGQHDYESFESLDQSGADYLRSNAGDIKKLKSDYEQGIQRSISHFERIIQEVEERGLSESTLIIYTSDHGELLGEYGLISHNHIACPELVYVPTTFVHPQLDDGNSSDLFRNVDIVPTILDYLDIDIDIELDGQPLQEQDSKLVGYNHYITKFYGLPGKEFLNRETMSVWDQGGGHVFSNTSKIQSVFIYLALLVKSPIGTHIRRTGEYSKSLSKFLPGWETYGEPSFSIDEANRIIKGIERRGRSQQVSLDADTQEQLKDLGYM